MAKIPGIQNGIFLDPNPACHSVEGAMKQHILGGANRGGESGKIMPWHYPAPSGTAYRTGVCENSPFRSACLEIRHSITALPNGSPWFSDYEKNCCSLTAHNGMRNLGRSKIGWGVWQNMHFITHKSGCILIPGLSCRQAPGMMNFQDFSRINKTTRQILFDAFLQTTGHVHLNPRSTTNLCHALDTNYPSLGEARMCHFQNGKFPEFFWFEQLLSPLQHSITRQSNKLLTSSGQSDPTPKLHNFLKS